MVVQISRQQRKQFLIALIHIFPSAFLILLFYRVGHRKPVKACSATRNAQFHRRRSDNYHPSPLRERGGANWHRPELSPGAGIEGIDGAFEDSVLARPGPIARPAFPIKDAITYACQSNTAIERSEERR